MKINIVSQKYGISKDTLRYWESIGLLPHIPRDASGYRNYSKQAQNWVYYIKALRNAGMSIERLIKFVDSYKHHSTDMNYRRQLLIEQRQQLIDEINQRQQTVDYLTYKIDHFNEHVMNQNIKNEDESNEQLPNFKQSR
jgi:MerR family transcriptional regulator, aldehyde-responsive regulator